MKGTDMEKMERKGIRNVMAAAVMAGALAWAAAARAQDLKFWIPLPLSGPLAVTGQGQQKGWENAIDWINKNGGIKGRKITASYYDDEYKVELGVAGFKKAVANGEVIFTGGDGTPFVRAISPENNETYKVLMSNTGAASDLVDTQKYKYHFLVGPNYSDQVDMLLNYIKTNHKGSSPPRLAYVYSATEFGRDPLARLHTRAKELGIDLVLEEQTQFVELDVTAHAIKLRNAKPEYVIFNGYAGNVWPEIVKLCRDYGMDNTQFMGTEYGSHPEVVSTVGNAANGYIGVVPMNLMVGGSTKPMIQTIDGYIKNWKEKPYTGYANIGYMQSWATALMLRKAIGAAIDKGEALNGDNLIKEVDAIKDWDADGVFGMPVSVVDQRIPYGVLYRYEIKNGKVTVSEAAPWARSN
jgi:branched-chain amino acid transport system substrate-binding protein